MEQAILGIDISKSSFDVSLLSNGSCKWNSFENNLEGFQRLDHWLHKYSLPQTHCCMEATGQYADQVAEYLYALGYEVSVVNPARIKFYGNSKLKRNKTDKADAELIAEYCLREKPGLWSPPPQNYKDLQALIRQLDALMESRQREKNRIKSGVRTQTVINSLNACIEFLTQQINQIKKAIQDLINSDPELHRRQKLLSTIKGIGNLTAAKLLGEIRDIRAFQSARQLAAFAGLTPKNILSGSSVRKKTIISKTGNAHLRKLLFLPAVTARHWNPLVKEFCDRLSENGLSPMEVVCAAMRKLLHLVYGILKSGLPFDPNYLKNSSVSS